VSTTPVANLQPVSTTQGELVEKFAAYFVDTGDTAPVANLPPVR
jgi:hypothetical protein